MGSERRPGLDRATPESAAEPADSPDALTSSYDFNLPPEAIAQRPAPRRDSSRLLLVQAGGSAEGHVFSELPELLRPGDLLIRNDAKVLPARLRGRRGEGGAAEILLVREGGDAWLCLARPANRFKPGREFAFAGGELTARVLKGDGPGMVWLEFSLSGLPFREALEKYGRLPLPPYLARPGKLPTPEDNLRYQTHYARRPGAVAAPTAGLHFTAELDERLLGKGVRLAALTLNVGPGTFRPVKAGRLADHRMEAEWYEIPETTWREALRTREAGGRVVAVGTTSARALETAAGGGPRPALSGWTGLFIRPGYRFRLVDGLLTNFHLPKSTPVALVSALIGRERTLSLYAAAAAAGYRFYSYGDAMLAWRG
ncbi:MAG: tRNA preQ1(34) S-adenosylmethionine ribosyltransferase-isomerase QueA [Planctomycetota bacterium]|jgi:S-adenosylmethionine:tRNA ribosyltransferase-isomerase|nr:tRNA preQ1(34) S-adenosylmethionine ribosyltransferase-isomerase QueA [Planctomycetota bacterium]